MIKRNGEIHWYTPKLCLIRQRVQLTDDSLPVEINTNATTAPGRTARWYRLSSFYYPFLSVMKNWSEILADVSESPSESVSTMLCVKHPLCLMSLKKFVSCEVRSASDVTLKWLCTQADETRVPLPCRSKYVLRIPSVGLLGSKNTSIVVDSGLV